MSKPSYTTNNGRIYHFPSITSDELQRKFGTLASLVADFLNIIESIMFGWGGSRTWRRMEDWLLKLPECQRTWLVFEALPETPHGKEFGKIDMDVLQRLVKYLQEGKTHFMSLN